MNALIRKEIRLLLPGWLAAAGVAMGAGLLGGVFGTPGFTLLLLMAGLLAAVASLAAFGREFSQGTFGALLALPTSRSRLWWTKTLVLAGSLGLLQLLVWAVFHGLAFRWPQLHAVARDFQFTPLNTGLALAAMYSGALWTTLVFRQVSAALWFTVFLPAALVMGGSWVAGFWTAEAAAHQQLAVGVILAYSVGGYLLAWRLFLAAEDRAERTAETNVLDALLDPRANRSAGAACEPTEPRVPTQDSTRSAARHHRRQRRPWTAVVLKEWRLQQPVLLVAAGLAALHLLALALRAYGGTWTRLPLISVGLDEVWGLWLLVPLLAGALAVAEERRLGLAELQRVLPVTDRVQWLIKLAMMLGVAVILGALPPWLFHSASRLPTWGLSTDAPWGGYLPLLWLLPVQVGLGLIALHASSLTRNPLQALSLALAEAALAVIVVQGLALPGLSGPSAPWEGLGGLWIGLPALVITLLVLARGNARTSQPTVRDGLRNLATVGIVLATAAALAAGLYHRAWERLAPEAVVRGPALWPASSQPILRHAGVATVLTPDGQATAFPTTYRFLFPFPGARNSLLLKTEDHVQRLPGRWRDLVATHGNVIGLQDDGSIWATETSRPSWIRSGDPMPFFAAMAPFGQDRDWAAVCQDPTMANSVFLLKTNGTLWRWSVPTDRASASTSFLRTPLRPILPDKRWASLHGGGSRLYLRDTDGRYWAANPLLRDRATESIQSDPSLVLYLCDSLHDGGPALKHVAGHGLVDFFIRQDGTLWTLSGFSRPGNPAGFQPLDASPDWIAVAADTRAALAVKRDGSLWRFGLGPWPDRTPERVGPFSHWRNVAAIHGALYALGDDGRLWRWNTDTTYFWGLAFAPSRRPTLAGQVAGPTP